MRIHGIQCRRADHITWRPSVPEIDRDLNGNPIPEHHTVFVWTEDCERVIDEATGIVRLDTSTASAIPQTPGGKKYAFGTWRQQDRNTTSQYIATRDGVVETKEYWTCTLYVRVGTSVYQGTIRRLDRPRHVVRNVKPVSRSAATA